MRKSLLFVFILLTSFTGFSQDFSNKGKDFWITSGWHFSMGTGNPPVMTLSLTSDVNTTYSIEAYGVGIITSGIIIANQVTNVNIPSIYFTYFPATNTGNGLFNGKAIHVTAAQPIVVYSFTTQALSSAATLCLPTNVLGKQYYAASYTQLSANPTGNNFITIIAVEDNTTVEIIPTKLTYGGWAPYSVNTINLNKGQIYQVLGAMTGNSGSDLTGTSIRSVASGLGGCKRIAVFSGSGRVWIPRTCSNGADNLYQQLYPSVSWGRKYLTVPSSDRLTNYYRIINVSATASVKLNGIVIPASFFVDHFYEFSNNTPNLIEGDTSICVVQYFTSADCIAGNPNPYDPDMIILNPVEQNISDVTLISSNRLAHTPTTPQHYIHVIMKNSGTAISSFKFDGGAIPPSAAWVTHPQDPAYSYLYLKNVSETYHSLKSDSGFNALAYGYAANETYAYSAGTNVRDLYTHPGTESQYGIDEGAVCTGSPFKFKISLPYKPDSIYWDLSTIINTPQYGVEKLLPIAPADTLVIDSITYVNSRPLYWYSLPGYYTFSNINSLTINITAFASNADGCGNSQEYIFPLDVSNPPTASFSVIPRLCYAEPYVFNETTPQLPKVTYKLWWEFFDPVTNIADTLTGGNPYRTVTHFFTTAGVKRVRHTSITSSGCLTDTIVLMITVPDLPSATINGTNMVCINGAPQNIVFTGSGAAPGGEYTFYYHINSGGQLNVNSSGGIATIQHNPTVAGTFIYTLDSVRMLGSTLCVNPLTGQQVTVTVNPDATIAIRAGDNASQTLCINNPMTQIRYDIAGSGTGGTVTFVPVLPGVTGTYAGGVVTIQGTPTLSGTFSYTVTPTGPCPYPGVPPGGIITVNNDATITLQSTGTDNQTKCVNTAITNIDYLVAGGATGATIAWVPTTPTGISFAPIGGGIYRISGASSVTGTFTYTINTQGPCIKPSLGGTLIVTAEATIAIRAGDNASQTLCINNPMTQIRYDIAGSGTGGTVTFVPVLPGVTGTYAGGVVTIQGTPTLSGTFSYTITPTGPCPYAGVPPGGIIMVNDDATITLQSTGTDNQTKCVNTAITNIDYLVAGGATGATIAWVPTTPTGISFAPIGGGIYRISGASSVTGTFTYTINTQGPCIKPSLGGTLTVNPDATIAIRAGDNASQTLCINNPMAQIRYDIAGSGTGGTVTFVPVLPGVTGTYAGGVVTIQGTPTVSGTFNYTITPTGPCPYPGVPPGGTITVNDDATIILQSTGTDNQTKCLNTAITNIDYLVAGGATGATITWVPTTPTGITFTPIGGGVYQIAGASSVTGTFTYTINTQGPCIKPSLGGTLTINPAPSASIAGTAEVCQNNPVWPGITFTGSGGTVPYTFTYTIDAGSGPGLPQTITTTGLNTSIQVQQPTGVAGTFTYKLLSVQDGSTSACSQAMNVPVQVIKVNELPNGTISGSNLVCINSTPRPDITFTASGGIVPYTFTYQVLPAGPLQTISTTGSNTSVTLQAPTNVAGTFTYRLISISDGSTAACVQNATVADVVIGVSDVFPAPDFAFTNSVCIPNAVVQFQNLSNIANGTPLTYLWNFGDGSPTQVSVNPSHQYSNIGPFNVSLKATSNAGCITNKVVVMNNIHPQPKANFSFNKPSVCIGDDVTLTDLSDGKDGVINQWHWDMGDGGIKTTSTVTYTYTDTITYNIKLYTINSQNCNSDTLTKQFAVYPYPHVNAGPDRSILEGGQITLSPVVYGNDLQFLWTPNQYLIDNRIEKVKVNKPLTDMTYRLTVTARGGCSLSDDVFVKLLKFPIIPNTFTPNNDGINDTWRIDYLNTYPNNVVQVFTRTGQLVFESRGYNTPWDGTIKGKPLPFDTYYYIIEPGNGREPLTGYVTILK